MRLRLDLLRFRAVINMPLGVKGFTFTAGLSGFRRNPEDRDLGLSDGNNLVHFAGTGVCIVLFSTNVLGVAGESNNLRARTLL